MRSIFSKLKKLLNPTFYWILVLVVLGFVVLYWGSRVGARGVYPLRDEFWRGIVAWGLWFAAAAVAIFAIGRWMWRRIANRKKAPPREPTREEQEVAAMRQMFDRVAKILKRRWEGRGRAIDGLPWYIVLGQKNAGKTSLIDNVDLRFPIDHEIKAELKDLEEFEAANFVEWRVSGNEAVILDLQGENLVPHSERDSVQNALWDAFVKNLTRLRSRRPVNGVVVTLDIAEFSQMSLDEREQYGQIIRRTIGDLIESLGTRLTVYVVFTKLDLIAGFKEFFGALTAHQREEIFGFHFEHRGNKSDDWETQFTEKYSAFLENLHQNIPIYLGNIESPEARRDAYAFYRSLVGMEKPLKRALDSMLAKDKFATPPNVRGVYFSSVRQENVPDNVFYDSIGERYRLPSPVYGTAQGKASPYFATGLFTKYVFPEAGLTSPNQKVERLTRFRSVAVGITTVLVTTTLLVYWYGQRDKNIAFAKSVDEKVDEYLLVEATQNNDGQVADFIEPLNTIREAALVYGDYRDVNGLVSAATLYQGKRISPIAEEAYLGTLNNHYMQRLTDEVAESLHNVCPVGGEEELNLLRVYRMLGNLDGRNNDVIKNYFAKAWQEEYLANAEVQTDLFGHLSYALDFVPHQYETRDEVIANAQASLSQITPYRRIFSTLRAKADRELAQNPTFQSAAGANFDIVYRPRERREVEPTNDFVSANGCQTRAELITASNAPFEVPAFYTRDNFFDYFIPANDDIAEISADDLWVLGAVDSTEYSEEDYRAIRDNVRDIYADEYIDAWRGALNNLDVIQFNDLRDAIEVTNVLGSADSPIRRISQLVTQQTQIFADDPSAEEIEGIEIDDNGLSSDPNHDAGIRINRAFLDIHDLLVSKQDDEPAKMAEVIEAIAAVNVYLKDIQDAPDLPAKALERSIERANLQGDDPIYVLRRIAEQMPPPFDEHLKTVADESWRMVLQEAAKALNSKWQSDIYGEYQRAIAGKYPFDRNSTVDLPVDDFIEFFKPGGQLDSFYRDELLVFIDERTGEPKAIDGQYLAVDPAFIQSLREATRITSGFFSDDGELGVTFEVSANTMDRSLLRSVFTVEGQVFSFAHAPVASATFIWPNVLQGPVHSRVDLSPVSRNGGAYAYSAEGVWSLLRLIDQASKDTTANNELRLRYSNRSGQSVVFEIRSENSDNLFVNSPLNGFNLPQELVVQRGVAADA